MNEITVGAWVQIIEGLIIGLVIFFIDFIAPQLGFHVAQGIGRYQIIAIIYPACKVLYGAYLLKEYR